MVCTNASPFSDSFFDDRRLRGIGLLDKKSSAVSKSSSASEWNQTNELDQDKQSGKANLVQF